MRFGQTSTHEQHAALDRAILLEVVKTSSRVTVRQGHTLGAWGWEVGEKGGGVSTCQQQVLQTAQLLTYQHRLAAHSPQPAKKARGTCRPTTEEVTV